MEYTFTTKKFALDNKNLCVAVKKFNPNIGKIEDKLNVPAQDYLFIKCENKDLFYSKLNSVTFPENIILTKQNFESHITI